VLKLGLSLAGGGAMGAYQVGILCAFIETGLIKYIKVISGCSVGSLNMLFFLKANYQLALKVWQSEAVHLMQLKNQISLTELANSLDILRKFLLRDSPNVNDEKLIDASLFSADYLKVLLDKYLQDDSFSGPVKCYATAAHIDMKTLDYFFLNNLSTAQIKSILLASSAIPSVFNPQQIGGRYYLDGGVVENLPIKPLLNENCDIIITSPLMWRERVSEEYYGEAEFLELVPSSKIGNVLRAVDFSTGYINKMIELGYSEQIGKLTKLAKRLERINK